MRVFRNIDLLPSFRNAVITVGTFDGVHKGHQQLISRIRSLAESVNGESVLITFDPHPRTVIYPQENSIRLLSTLDEKISLLEKEAIDNLVVVPFTKEFSNRSAREYVEHFLVGKFHPAIIVIGYNHSFGHHRDGNIELLKKLSSEFKFNVEEINKQIVDEIAVSSSRIRIALEEKDCDLAFHLLGRFYPVRGLVIDGDKIGRTLGYPTANISVGNSYKLIPADGIYAVYVTVEGKQYKGMLSIGYRPTVGGTKKMIEVNIFDFSKNIYGQTIEISFVKWLRAEEKYHSLDALKTQLGKDKTAALKVL